jgi:hypothetical protein
MDVVRAWMFDNGYVRDCLVSERTNLIRWSKGENYLYSMGIGGEARILVCDDPTVPLQREVSSCPPVAFPDV